MAIFSKAFTVPPWGNSQRHQLIQMYFVETVNSIWRPCQVSADGNAASASANTRTAIVNIHRNFISPLFYRTDKYRHLQTIGVGIAIA